METPMPHFVETPERVHQTTLTKMEVCEVLDKTTCVLEDFKMDLEVQKQEKQHLMNQMKSLKEKFEYLKESVCERLSPGIQIRSRTDPDQTEMLKRRIHELKAENKRLQDEVLNQRAIIHTLNTNSSKNDMENVNEWKEVRYKNASRNAHNKQHKQSTAESNNRYFSLEDSIISDVTEVETKEKEKVTQKHGKRRPSVAITENYITSQQHVKTVPGNRRYASATRYGKKICIIGDSHIKRIKKNVFNGSISNAKAYINCFSGANSKRLEHYILPTLVEDKPDIVIIHIGSNDVTHDTLSQININNITERIINKGKQCLNHGVKEVLISSIFLKKQLKLTKIIRQINDTLREKCRENKFYFICNDNITLENLWKDGIHLNNEGTHIFASNLVDFLNDFILSGNI